MHPLLLNLQSNKITPLLVSLFLPDNVDIVLEFYTKTVEYGLVLPITRKNIINGLYAALKKVYIQIIH
jgi:ABC-type transport system involved in multi-copper enzyme maturation permease subunit